jgi:hypothetical protein
LGGGWGVEWGITVCAREIGIGCGQIV